MPSFHYTHTRERDRNTSPPPVLRRASYKRQRLFDSDSDDIHDDYPYSGAHKPSRALVRRDTPSQLERWNIWSDNRKDSRSDSAAPDDALERDRRGQRRVSFADEVNEDEEALFRLRVASFSRTRPRHVSPPPRACHTESDDERVRAHVWPGELFHRRERCVSEDFEARERARSRERERTRRERFWGDDEGIERETETEAERWVRWRRVKRARTEEWRPLAGWRRV